MMRAPNKLKTVNDDKNQKTKNAIKRLAKQNKNKQHDNTNGYKKERN